MAFLKHLRWQMGRSLAARLVKHDFSVISEDCWGGQIYKELGRPYLTPTAGLIIESAGYLRFLENLRAPDATNLVFENDSAPHPIARTPYARIHFLHYESREKAESTFRRRYERIKWDNLLFKIDFGKPGCDASHIERWNKLKLKNSVALFPSGITDLWEKEIHNGVMVSDWTKNGVLMLSRSRKHFDLIRWINEGHVTNSKFYILANKILFP